MLHRKSMFSRRRNQTVGTHAVWSILTDTIVQTGQHFAEIICNYHCCRREDRISGSCCGSWSNRAICTWTTAVQCIIGKCLTEIRGWTNGFPVCITRRCFIDSSFIWRNRKTDRQAGQLSYNDTAVRTTAHRSADLDLAYKKKHENMSWNKQAWR